MASPIGLFVALWLSFVQPLSLDTVLARAASSSVIFHRDFGQLVMRETYVQRFNRALGYSWTMQSVQAEMAIVADEPAATWHAYRDVFEIDGRRLPGNGAGRLERALLDPRLAGTREAQRIAEEGSPQLLRGPNHVALAPTLALMVLLPDHQPRFAFEMRGEKRVSTTTVRVIRFRELRGHMFFRDASGQELPMAGELWVDPQSGAMLRATFAVEAQAAVSGGVIVQPSLAAAPGFSRMKVEVTFNPDPGLGVAVPVEMRETLSREIAVVGGGPRLDAVAGTQYLTQQLTCVATYTGHRQVAPSRAPEPALRP